jgi:hypothetical protein
MSDDANVLEATSHYLFSKRLKLYYVDWNNAETTPLLCLFSCG